MSHRSVPNESPRLRRSVLSCPASSATIKRSQPKRRSGASRKNDRRHLQPNGTKHHRYDRKIEIGVEVGYGCTWF